MVMHSIYQIGIQLILDLRYSQYMNIQMQSIRSKYMMLRQVRYYMVTLQV